MESAGAAVAARALALASTTGRFFVLCGPGNNGGDGAVAGRVLLEKGRTVQVLRADPEEWHPLAEPQAGDVVVDALFGIGLNRPLLGSYSAACDRIQAWRKRGARVLAVDVPSGLQSDSGQPLGACVQADETLTFGTLKPGLVTEPGAGFAGKVTVVDIGLPELTSTPYAWLLEDADVHGVLPRREANSHKGTFGHLLLVAGSPGKSGAAALAGMAALRSGAGLVTVATPESQVDQVLGHAPELMGLALEATGGLGPQDAERLLPELPRMSAIAVGPGIPRGGETAEFLSRLLAATSVPVVLDADALNALEGRLDVLASAKGPVVLTPHPGEMARLTGLSAAEIQKTRIPRARTFAQRHKVVLALKGARTVVALPSGEVRVNPTGNPGLAKGGTGDVLTGVIGALLAQRLEPADAASAGVYVHGLAADKAVATRGQAGLLASDVVEALCQVWVGWGR
jgi:NAD(P)H-hydrate epimerase